MKLPIHLITGSSIGIYLTQLAVLWPGQLVQIINRINVEFIIRLFLFFFLFFFLSTWFISHIRIFLKIITAGSLNNGSPNNRALCTALRSGGAGATFLTNKLSLPGNIAMLLSTTITNSPSRVI